MKVNLKPKGLFLNPSEAQCSIYESGRMAYQALLLSNRYELDYLEIDEKNRAISNQYDFYLFNYHNVTMAWLDTKYIYKLPGIKMTIVLEVLPNNPFALCPSADFDVYLALDPTMNVPDKNVYAFPRPLEDPPDLRPYQETTLPTIGTFGFATPGKGFELVVDAVNKEFDEAVIRINIPSGTYANDMPWKLRKQNYAEYLGETCKKIAKKGIEVIITHNFMTKEELIAWCSQNTLNCFLYNRNRPGLSATTDQAIASGRPLAVSEDPTFRHIHSYIKPYPLKSLRESIRDSQPLVLRMKNEWHPEMFARKFETVLEDLTLFSGPQKTRNFEIIELRVVSKNFSSLIFRKLANRLKRTLNGMIDFFKIRIKNKGAWF